MPGQFFLSADYAPIAEITSQINGLIGEDGRVQRGSRQVAASDFHAVQAWLMDEAKKGRTIQRFKGLGEMNPEQLWETTVNPETRRMLQVRIEERRRRRPDLLDPDGRRGRAAARIHRVERVARRQPRRVTATDVATPSSSRGYRTIRTVGPSTRSHWALSKVWPTLGHDAIRSDRADHADRRAIVLAPHLLPLYGLAVPDDAILYNLEQIDRSSSWITPELLALFRDHALWDYSERNREALVRRHGITHAELMPVGHSAGSTHRRRRCRTSTCCSTGRRTNAGSRCSNPWRVSA